MTPKRTTRHRPAFHPRLSPQRVLSLESLETIVRTAAEADKDMARRSLFVILAVGAAAIALTGCGSTGTAVVSEGGLDLVGTRWLVEDIDGKGVIDMLQTTLGFDSNTRVLANGGCNNAFGNVTFKGDEIEFGAFGVTMKMCSEAISDQEMRFFKALGETRRYRLDAYKDLLYFMDADGREIIRFSRMAPLETEPVDD